MYYVGFCPICGHGAVGLRVCGGQPAHTLLMCDECDAVWREPNLAAPPIFGEAEEVPCPVCSATLLRPPAHWADGEESQRSGWWSTVLAEGQALGEEPDAPDPPRGC